MSFQKDLRLKSFVNEVPLKLVFINVISLLYSFVRTYLIHCDIMLDMIYLDCLSTISPQ